MIDDNSLMGICCDADKDEGEMVISAETMPIIEPIETKNKCSYKTIFLTFDLLNPIALMTESSFCLSKTPLTIIIPTPRVPTRTPNPPKTLNIDM